MSKIEKFVKSFGIVCLILFLLSIGLAIFINLFEGPLKLSIVQYFNFFLDFNGSFSNLNILSVIALIVLLFGTIFSVLWLILLLIKKHFIVFAYFIGEIIISLLFSYCFLLYADFAIDGTSFNYFKEVTDLAKSGEVVGLVLIITFLFLTSLTFCFSFVHGILTIVYAYEQKECCHCCEHERETKEVAAKDEALKEEKETLKKEERILLVKPRSVKENEVKTSSISESSKKKTHDENEKVSDKIKESSNEETIRTVRVYHISHHPTEDKWQVKLAKGEKAIKLFDTQLEAIEYAKELSKNQGGSIRLHSVAGRIRKI